MIINWENVMLGLLAALNAIAGWNVKRLIDTVDRLNDQVVMLSRCISIQKVWREEHDKRHNEVRTDHESERRDLWNAIETLRKEK